MKYFVATMMVKGKKTDQGLYAEDKKEAHYLAKIKFKGTVIRVTESSPPLEDQIKKFTTNFIKNIKQKKLKQDALIGAMQQLAVMSNAGISLNESLGEIGNATEDPVLKELLLTMADDINAGYAFSQTAEKFRFQLGNLSLAMIELGEKTGNMAESVKKLADMLEEVRRSITKFKKAMAYPRNVMIAMAIAFTTLISYVVPKFKEIFANLGADLPAPTKLLLFLEHAINTYGLYILITIFSIIMVLKYFITHSRAFRYKFHGFLLKTYLIKNVIKFATLNRFTLVFSELVHAGIPIAEALETSINMIDNMVLKDKLLLVRQTVEKGGQLNDGLRETGMFENMIVQMIKAGEASGQLDAMLDKVSDYYKQRFDAIIDGVSEAIEPIILIMITGLVLMLALGIFLPMWSMGDAANGRKS